MSKFYIAEIKENNDTKAIPAKLKEGSVQIYIEQLMHDIEEKDLPWARPMPFGSGGSSTQGISSIPEKDSKVWVYFEDEEFWRNPYYIGDVHLKNLTPNLLAETILASALPTMSSKYPDIKFRMEKNGIILGQTSGATPEIFIIHPAGSSIFINTLGAIEIKSSTFITLNSGDALFWKPNTLPVDPFTGIPHSTIVKLKGA